MGSLAVVLVGALALADRSVLEEPGHRSVTTDAPALDLKRPISGPIMLLAAVLPVPHYPAEMGHVVLRRMRRHADMLARRQCDVGDLPAHVLLVPSADAGCLAREAVALEAARRAAILRKHATHAAARGDADTITRLEDAATAADTVARAMRRRHLRTTPAVGA
jgi:hypothetical protein